MCFPSDAFRLSAGDQSMREMMVQFARSDKAVGGALR
jgi:hypothetical protein